MSGIVEDLIGCTDEILGLRDEIGAVKSHVHILTRTWSGEEVGDGNPSDTIEQILPTPYVVNLHVNSRVKTGGAVKEGDVMLKHISKQSYPDENTVSLKNDNCKTVEKFYYLDGKLYNMFHVTSDYIYWNVHVRLTTKKKVYL